MTCINPDLFDFSKDLPKDLVKDQVIEAFRYSGEVIATLNDSLSEYGVGSLDNVIQGNSFSGVVSNVLTRSIDIFTPYKDNSETQYPDLVGPRDGIEIKATTNHSKGGEAHNGHEGWHMVNSYFMSPEKEFFWGCVKIAYLKTDDWKYCGSIKTERGTHRTENYSTTREGRKKLIDGIIYMDQSVVTNFNRWRY